MPGKERHRAAVSIQLDTAGWRWVFALLILVISAGFCWEAGRAWVAAEYGRSGNPELWRRAAQLEPGNADYWAELGSREAWDFERGDLRRAAADYERAVKANPDADRTWLELAEIDERLGETSLARGAFEKAQFNHPISSEAGWRYGNFLLRQGEVPEAWAQFRKALMTNPAMTEAVLTACWKTEHFRPEAIGGLLPPQNRYYFKALDYFRGQNEIETALGVWNEVVALRQPFELPEALPFLDDVISAGRVSDAERVWQQALEISGWPRDARENGSLVFNGGFERKFANGGFDWRKLVLPGTSFAFDTAVAHSGARSLRISFDGKANLDFRHLVQYVAVLPEHRYNFTAYLRSFAVSTDSGMRFLIADPVHPSLLQVSTPSVTGTQAWTKMSTDFVTEPQTHLVSLVLRRTPSEKFDNKLNGTVWVDDAALVLIPGNGKRLAP